MWVSLPSYISLEKMATSRLEAGIQDETGPSCNASKKKCFNKQTNKQLYQRHMGTLKVSPMTK